MKPRIYYDHWLFRLPYMKRFVGLTCGRFIFLAYTEQEMKLVRFGYILRHEMIHQEQMNRYTVPGFLILYIAAFWWEFFKCWNWMKAYRNNPFEVEAYERENE